MWHISSSNKKDEINKSSPSEDGEMEHTIDLVLDTSVRVGPGCFLKTGHIGILGIKNLLHDDNVLFNFPLFILLRCDRNMYNRHEARSFEHEIIFGIHYSRGLVTLSLFFLRVGVSSPHVPVRDEFEFLAKEGVRHHDIAQELTFQFGRGNILKDCTREEDVLINQSQQFVL